MNRMLLLIGVALAAPFIVSTALGALLFFPLAVYHFYIKGNMLGVILGGLTTGFMWGIILIIIAKDSDASDAP